VAPVSSTLMLSITDSRFREDQRRMRVILTGTSKFNDSPQRRLRP
jgi:hypothetical protein